MLQNLSSSTESAYANTEASVSGHRLDRRQEYRSCRQKEEFFPSREENGTWKISVELKLDLEYF